MNVSAKSFEILNNVRSASSVEPGDNSIKKRIANLEESKKAIQEDLNKVKADPDLTDEQRKAKVEPLEEKLKTLQEEIAKAKVEETKRLQDQMQAKMEAANNAKPSDPAVSKEQEKAAASVEFYSKVNYQMHQIHKLRRTKSQLESQIHHTESAIDATGATRASDYNVKHLEKLRSGAAGMDEEISSTLGEANKAVNAHTERIKRIDETDRTLEENEDTEGSAHYKTGAAISGYKTYKSDQPKAWESGEVNERR